MPTLRWQFRLRTILILVVVAALLTSGALWAAKMRQRYLTNRQRAPSYTLKAFMFGLMADSYAQHIRWRLATVFEQSPDDAIPQIKKLNREYVRLMKRKAQYDHAATHPWDPILSDNDSELRLADASLAFEVPQVPPPSDPETRPVWRVCRALGLLPEIDPRIRASVVTLYLDGSDVTDEALDNLRTLPNLEELVLDHTKLSDSSLARLESLTKLRTLVLRDTSIGDAGLPHLQRLPHLESLNLAYTRVTNQGMLSLQRLPHLRELRLLGTAISDEGVGHLEALPELAIVDLRETKITDAALRSLARLKTLEQVEIDDTSVTPAAIEDLLKQRPALHMGPVVETSPGLPPLPPALGLPVGVPPPPPGAMLPAELPPPPPGLRP